jgi:hypothetical protein
MSKIFPLVFFVVLCATWRHTLAQKAKAAKKEHYYGAYIGDFQDRFHGVTGQVNRAKLNFTSGLG